MNPAKAWGNLANILNNQGNTVEAENAYRQALAYRGNMADVHYNLGVLLQVKLLPIVLCKLTENNQISEVVLFNVAGPETLY